ncbi:hypothetical protein MPER_14618, partial [Moniliophthora perniciosa FA553]
PVDVFITYDGRRASDIPISRYAVRHLVAEEVDARIGSQTADIVEKGTGKTQFFGKSTRNSGTIAEADSLESGSSDRPSKRARLEPTDIADKPPTDFFGRLINPSAATTTSNKRGIVLKENGKKFRVSYRFKEGNSAA